MPGEPDYYALLGVEPTATTEAITAAYRGRLLPFRVGQVRHSGDHEAGPGLDDIEQAYAVLGNPARRAAYDAKYFPGKPADTAPRRRVPVWAAAVLAIWLLGCSGLGLAALRSRLGPNSSFGGQPVPTPTAGQAISTGTIMAQVPPTATSQTMATHSVLNTLATPLTMPAPTATASSVPTGIVIPTATVTTVPTATLVPVTATPVPPPTEVPIAPTEAPVPTEVPVEPAPAPFPATDRIGTTRPVNLRSGPGLNYQIVDVLNPGTLLQATGRSSAAAGQLWRQFTLADGRTGWVRDIDVLAVP